MTSVLPVPSPRSSGACSPTMQPIPPAHPLTIDTSNTFQANYMPRSSTPLASYRVSRSESPQSPEITPREEIDLYGGAVIVHLEELFQLEEYYSENGYSAIKLLAIAFIVDNFAFNVEYHGLKLQAKIIAFETKIKYLDKHMNAMGSSKTPTTAIYSAFVVLETLISILEVVIKVAQAADEAPDQEEYDKIIEKCSKEISFFKQDNHKKIKFLITEVIQFKNVILENRELTLSVKKQQELADRGNLLSLIDDFNPEVSALIKTILEEEDTQKKMLHPNMNILPLCLSALKILALIDRGELEFAKIYAETNLTGTAKNIQKNLYGEKLSKSRKLYNLIIKDLIENLINSASLYGGEKETKLFNEIIKLVQMQVLERKNIDFLI